MSEKAEKMKARIEAVTPKNKTEPYNVWFDETAPGQEFTHAEMMKRMKEVHGIDTANTKGKRSMSMHMDGDTWFSYVWDWEIAGKKFTNSTRQNRRGMDRDIWANGG